MVPFMVSLSSFSVFLTGIHLTGLAPTQEVLYKAEGP